MPRSQTHALMILSSLAAIASGNHHTHGLSNPTTSIWAKLSPSVRRACEVRVMVKAHEKRERRADREHLIAVRNELAVRAKSSRGLTGMSLAF